MKRAISMVLAVLFVFSATGFTALGASDTNDVYDFEAGEFPSVFFPYNQSVDTWNEFTGLEVEEGDWLNMTYTNATNESVSVYFEVFEDYVNCTFDIDIWANITIFGIFTNYTMTVDVSVNNDSADPFIPLFPVDEDDWYDGAQYTVIAVGDKEMEYSDIGVRYVEEYEADDDVLDDTGINWTTDDEPAIVLTYDDIEYPLATYGFYYIEDEEIFVQVGELAEESGTITYVIFTNFDGSMAGEAVSETRRYWGQEGESFTARYLTGKESTFTVATGTDYTVFDVPEGNIARIKIGSGVFSDYEIEMTGATYTIDRLWRAWGMAEAIDDLASTDSDILAVEGVYLSRITVWQLSLDDDDLITVEYSNVFTIDNTYDYGVANWYGFGSKTTEWKIKGFSWF